MRKTEKVISPQRSPDYHTSQEGSLENLFPAKMIEESSSIKLRKPMTNPL
jgi:hypothetical protein